MIGLCVVTYNRPSYAERCLKAIRKHLTDVVDHIVVVNDGSDSKFNGEYKRVAQVVQSMNATYIALDKNAGVAVAKNAGLQHLLDKGCDWLFTCEDDIIVQSPRAITEYVRIAKDIGLPNLSFAHHGAANVDGPVATDGDVAYFFHSVGAWCLMTRESCETYGLLDENFVRAWEHVERELRVGIEPHRYPDVARSSEYLKEIPGSIEKSSIRPLPDWWERIRTGLIYWRDNKPDTYKMLFGDGMPLEQYAKGVIGA